MASLNKMEYGELEDIPRRDFISELAIPVRLGNSGLKVSRIILGTMQYGK